MKLHLGKLGQMEMVGLVVIVILITLGMLFMAQFALKNSGEKKIFTRKGLAYSAMSALMKTNLACQQPNGNIVYPQLGGRIMEDCALNYGREDYFYDYNCAGLNSCDYLQLMVNQLLNETLAEWNKRYELQSDLVIVQGESAQTILSLNSSKGGCPKGRDRDSSGAFPLPTGAGYVESVLYICD